MSRRIILISISLNQQIQRLFKILFKHLRLTIYINYINSHF